MKYVRASGALSLLRDHIVDKTFVTRVLGYYGNMNQAVCVIYVLASALVCVLYSMYCIGLP